MSTSERGASRRSRGGTASATLAMLATLALAACTDLLGIEPTRAPAGAPESGGLAGAGGEAGEGGLAGSHAGDEGSSASGGLGARSAGGGMSGSRDGEERGGTSGDGVGGDGGDAGGGAGGGSGDGGVPEWPEEGDACWAAGRHACPGPRATYELECDGTTWRRARECRSNELCNRLTGLCSGMLCNPQEPFSLVICGYPTRVCGPDYVTWESEDCSFTCRDGVGCIEPDDEQVYLDRPRSIQMSFNPWPGSLIPVCLENADTWTDAEIALVKDTYYRNWGRYVAMGLSGFGPCGADSEGIALEIADRCDRELARVPQTGYPGPSATLPITLCRSYLDADGDLRRVSNIPGLFELAVTHVFGHVFGLEDEVYSSGGGTFMQQGIDLDQLANFTFPGNNFLVSSVQRTYGMTPRGSISGPTGRCLAWPSSKDAPVRDVCDGSPARSFRAVDGRLEHVGSGECLRLAGKDSVVLGDCSGAERWQTQRVEWRAYAGRCVTAQPPSTSVRELIATSCTPARAADQTWRFEFPARDRARIRLAKSGACVRSDGAYPWLGACDGVHDLFDTGHGELSVGGLCLTFVGPLELDLRVCAGGYDQRFGLSGPLESEAGALTALADDGVVDLRVSPRATPTAEEQTFDFYF